MNTRKYISIVVLLFASTMIMSAQTYKYIGAAKCKMCHNKPPKGEQYNKWSELLHANAMKSLSNQLSLDYAKKNGIADPTKDAGCLSCHSTAASVDKSLHAGIKVEEGVSCESCHGPGSAYRSPAVMKNQRIALQKGLIIPTKEVCEKCHNDKNPFHQPFNFDEKVKLIAHPDPTRK